MTIDSLKTGLEDGVDIVKLGLSNGSFLSVKSCYIDNYSEFLRDLDSGKDISAQDEEALRFASSCYSAEKAGIKLLARAEQRRLVLTAKLERRGFNPACVRAVISRFLELNLLNDGRYAETWLRGRLSRRGGKPFGPRKLSAMLQNRGIDRETALSALQSVLDPDTEWALLMRFLEKSPFSGPEYSIRSRLRAEGFSSEVLNRYFDECACSVNPD